MNKMTLNKALITMLLLLMATHSQAGARQADDGVAAKAQYLLRQIAAERDALKVENSRQKTELAELKGQYDKYKKQAKKLKAQLNGVKKNLGNTEGTLSKYKKTNDLLRESLTKNRDRTRELIVKFRKTIGVLRKVEAKNMEQVRLMQTQGQKIKSCEKMNAGLYQTGADLLDAYDKKGLWQSLLQAEPVTGLGRVNMENLIEEYRHKMQRQRNTTDVGLVSD